MVGSCEVGVAREPEWTQSAWEIPLIVGSRTTAPNVAFANSAKAGERQPEQENLSINPQQLVVGWTTFVIIKNVQTKFFFLKIGKMALSQENTIFKYPFKE